MAKTIKVAGEGHTIKKNKKGEVIVDHAGKKKKYDKINLTKKVPIFIGTFKLYKNTISIFS